MVSVIIISSAFLIFAQTFSRVLRSPVFYVLSRFTFSLALRSPRFTFSRALRQLQVVAYSFDWFSVLSASFVIGWSNYYGFGFTTLNQTRFLTGTYRLLLIEPLSVNPP